MQANAIPIRTAEGEHEINTRGRKLSWQARALLVSINGHKSVEELGHVLTTPEATNKAFEELLALQLIDLRTPVVVVPEPITGAGITPLQQARQLLNDTAVGALGLLGGFSAFRFTLKLERCYSAAELRAVFPDYRRLVVKSKGEDYVQSIFARVEKLLEQAG